MSESSAAAAEDEPAQWPFDTAQVQVGFDSTGTPKSASRCSAVWSPRGQQLAGRAFAGQPSRSDHVATIGDVRSVVIHPASMTRRRLMLEEPTCASIPRSAPLALDGENVRAGFAAAAT
ncbi:hypothetical protein [Nocardia sp. R6R-6]|uniref:hypothetical protein n=1 Tax=Nocardia sp. R6R-6 TaxID=3459303 RepID=UPI00403DC417